MDIKYYNNAFSWNRLDIDAKCRVETQFSRKFDNHHALTITIVIQIVSITHHVAITEN